MSYLKNLFLIISALMMLPSISYSLDVYPAAPYTEEATNKLAAAGKKIAPPIVGEKATTAEGKKEQVTKLLYDYYREWFSKAGYSFDKSVIQLSKDFEKNHDLLQSNPLLMRTGFAATFGAAIQFSEINRQVGLSDKVLPKSTMEAMQKIVKILDADRKASEEKKRREEMEQQRREEELKKKHEEEARQAEEKRKQEELLATQEKAKRRQDLINKIPGHYENDNGNKSAPAGILEIQLVSESSIKFSGYNKLLYNQCKAADKIATIVDYDDYRGIVTAIFEEGSSGTDEECKIEMEFGKYSESVRATTGHDFFVELTNKGKCRQYCERGGRFDGRYSQTILKQP